MKNFNNDYGYLQISFFEILFFIFLILKLIGKITWSWWIVCMPLYLPIFFGFLIFLIILFVFYLKR